MKQDLIHLAALFLLSTVVFVPVFVRLGLGSVLGYLFAGVVFGPSVFGLVTDYEHIMHFSEFGVVLLLFIVGLELEPDKLWNLRKRIFGAGTIQVLACGLLVALAAVFLMQTNWPAAIAIGMATSLSSTAIALQILNERNLLNTDLGKSSFSILLFQDLAVILMISLLPILTTQESPSVHIGDGESHSGIWQFLKIAGLFVGLFFVGKWTLRPMLRWIASLHLREVFTAFALFIVVGMALLMDSLGISQALGAFLSGVLLAESEYRKALETDLEPFKGLLLGLFFTSVGFSIDLQFMATNAGAISIWVGLILAIKLSVNYLLSLKLKMQLLQRLQFSLLLGQVGEFAFVLLGMALAMSILDKETSAMLVSVTVVTMALTPVLVFVLQKWVEPRLLAAKVPPAEEVIEKDNAVIIAGFGRFGQIIGRFLYANGFSATVLDHEPEQIESLRRFGFKVFFGDATRADLLEAAGAKNAKVIVNAIDQVEDNLALVDAVRQHFPNLKIYSRARNVQHYYDLLDRKVECIERETFESSLSLGVELLKNMGWAAYPAYQASRKFREHNLEALLTLHPLRGNQTELIARARQSREDMEQMFEKERQARVRVGPTWNA